MLGDDWSDAGQRLPLRVESSDQVLRLFDGDTWARLLGVTGGKPVIEPRVFSAPSPQHHLDAEFDGKIQLLGYDLDCDPQPEACDLVLYWQAEERLDKSYTSFVQMLDPEGKVQAQADAVPQNGGYLTNWWLPGEIVVDAIRLELAPDAPRDVPYRLVAGWYDAATGVRLPLSGASQDFFELTILEP
jgi:hypothetical protein